MGFFKDLKKHSRKAHKKMIEKLRLKGKNGAIAKTAVNSLPGIPPGAKDIYTVAKKTVKHSEDPKDLIGNTVRYGTRQADKEGKILGTVGTYLVVGGTLTAQPELVEAGEGMQKVESVINVATVGGEDLATGIDDLIKGDPKAAVHAFGEAYKKTGIAVFDHVSDGEFSQLLEVSEDIIEGNYSSALKASAHAIVDGVSGELGVSHLKGQVHAAVERFENQGQLEEDSPDDAPPPSDGKRLVETHEKGKPPGLKIVGEGAMSGGQEGFSATNLPSMEDFPGGAVRAEETMPASELDPTTTLARKTLKAKVAVNENLDDEITMCGGSMYHQSSGLDELVYAATPVMHREGHKRGYSALKMVPVQYSNNGLSTSNRLDRPVKVARVTSMVHENPIKNKLKNRPTVRGFSANFTSKPRMSAQPGDARGDKVVYKEQLPASKGRIQLDETDFARERSMSILDTVPEETLVIDATGPMKSTVRSRRITRSMAKHERDMRTVA